MQTIALKEWESQYFFLGGDSTFETPKDFDISLKKYSVLEKNRRTILLKQNINSVRLLF